MLVVKDVYFYPNLSAFVVAVGMQFWFRLAAISVAVRKFDEVRPSTLGSAAGSISYD